MNQGDKASSVYTAGHIRLDSVIEIDTALGRGPEYSNYMV